jgi:transposase
VQILHASALLDILQRWYAGMPKARIAREIAVDRKTVRKYIRIAEAAGMRPGGPPLSDEEWADRAREWYPDVLDTRRRQTTWAAIHPHRDRVAALVGTMSTASAYRVLRTEAGLSVSLASFRRYVRAEGLQPAPEDPAGAP